MDRGPFYGKDPVAFFEAGCRGRLSGHDFVYDRRDFFDAQIVTGVFVFRGLSRRGDRSDREGFCAAVPHDFEGQRRSLALGCGIEKFDAGGDVPSVYLFDVIADHQPGFCGWGVGGDGLDFGSDVLE